VFGLIPVIISAVAAWRLSDTPLFSTAAGFAAAGLFFWLACQAVAARTGDDPPGWLVGFTHVCSGMGGFFLFVSFAMP
jgi:hypothetical protein